MNALDYHWTVERGFAVLHETWRDPVNYTRESLNDAISNIRARRTDYTTPVAWQRRLSMYEEGRTLLELHTTKS